MSSTRTLLARYINQIESPSQLLEFIPSGPYRDIMSKNTEQLNIHAVETLKKVAQLVVSEEWNPTNMGIISGVDVVEQHRGRVESLLMKLLRNSYASILWAQLSRGEPLSDDQLDQLVQIEKKYLLDQETMEAWSVFLTILDGQQDLKVKPVRTWLRNVLDSGLRPLDGQIEKVQELLNSCDVGSWSTKPTNLQQVVRSGVEQLVGLHTYIVDDRDGHVRKMFRNLQGLVDTLLWGLSSHLMSVFSGKEGSEQSLKTFEGVAQWIEQEMSLDVWECWGFLIIRVPDDQKGHFEKYIGQVS